MRIVLATTQVPFVRGGAELLAESLRTALRADGHEAEIAAIPFKWYPPERILDHILACRLLDLTESYGEKIDLLIGLKFPAYLIAHPAKTYWIAHQYRSAYDLWGTDAGDLHRAPTGAHLREVIREADRQALAASRNVNTISKNVSGRLKAFCGIDSRPLYHPPAGAEHFRLGEYGDYLLVPSRIDRLKRQDLVIEALERTRQPVRACFMGAAGGPNQAEAFRRRIARSRAADRITWLGEVDEARKFELYAGCCAVVFPPVDEDYGYITLEAMLAGKAVVTCTDSGGPLEFVNDRETGFICAPDADALAAAMDTLWENRALARSLGLAGNVRYKALEIGWDRVLSCLLA